MPLKPVSQIHKPVLLAQVMEALAPKAGGRYLDATLGLGGHAERLLEEAPGCVVAGLDRDAEALALAQARLSPYGGRLHCFHLPFSAFAKALEALRWPQIDGALLDLGVSSLQLDTPERGFSFCAAGPLDMRMDQSAPTGTAWQLVNRGTYEELRNIIAEFGEDPQAGRIARAIIDARQKRPLGTTEELARIVRSAYPRQWRVSSRRNPATRTFQALRMAVNNELKELESFLHNICPWLAAGARLVIISFHSLEDRLVKNTFRNWARAGCPETGGAAGGRISILFKKPVAAEAEEIAANPRASCAKMRAVEKIAG